MTEPQNDNRSREEQVGFHKGSLSTLAKEREELVRILSIVEQLMQMHIKALQEMGVDLSAQAKQAAEAASSSGENSASAAQNDAKEAAGNTAIEDKLKNWKL